jgi:hypothetical protein
VAVVPKVGQRSAKPARSVEVSEGRTFGDGDGDGATFAIRDSCGEADGLGRAGLGDGRIDQGFVRTATRNTVPMMSSARSGRNLRRPPTG